MRQSLVDMADICVSMIYIEFGVLLLDRDPLGPDVNENAAN